MKTKNKPKNNKSKFKSKRNAKVNYKRDVIELKENAAIWWPQELIEKEKNTSVIPLLVKTQEEFLSVLNLAGKDPKQVISILKASKFPFNLFTKHLCVLSDVGGEKLQRINTEFNSLFPEKKIHFFWKSKMIEHNFTALPAKSLTNSKLKIDGDGIQNKESYSDLYQDVIILLLFGSTSQEAAETLQNCEVGTMLGETQLLEKYVKEKYIHVSRITGGATANSLGQLLQHFIAEKLTNLLGKGYAISFNGSIPGISQNNRTLTSFDVVVNKGKEYCAIEVSFQVTTNSTIERKGGQAKSRYDAIKAAGHHIAYVIDGAGNFQRESAIKNICDHSDCTVGFKESEMHVLASFIKGIM